ncbi:MAG: hypothetical protein ACK417_07210 [Bacteroidia bacterium]
MLRKLLIVVLVFSLSSAATASEWLLPLDGEHMLAGYGLSDEAAEEEVPQHFIEPLQSLPIHISGFQLRAEMPQSAPAHQVFVTNAVIDRAHEKRPEALIHRQKVLLTCTMQALAP